MKKMSIVLTGVLLLLGVGVSYGEQKVVFIIDHAKYVGRNAAIFCPDSCNQLNDGRSIEKLLNTGWKVITATPKERVIASVDESSCTCVGTQYIVEKEMPK